jgi:hypothetical protein
MGVLSATDLRIGNLYYYRVVDHSDQRKEWFEVSKIDYDDLRVIAIKDEMNQDYQPIPLTEEWLLKFGFEVYEFNHKENQYGFKDRLIVIRDGFFCDYGSSVIIKHVHQLQNLYFALTGTELIQNNVCAKLVCCNLQP